MKCFHFSLVDPCSIYGDFSSDNLHLFSSLTPQYWENMRCGCVSKVGQLLMDEEKWDQQFLLTLSFKIHNLSTHKILPLWGGWDYRFISLEEDQRFTHILIFDNSSSTEHAMWTCEHGGTSGTFRLRKIYGAFFFLGMTIRPWDEERCFHVYTMWRLVVGPIGY